MGVTTLAAVEIDTDPLYATMWDGTAVPPAFPPRSWSIDIIERPLTANEDRRLHFRARAERDVLWRHQGKILAKAAKIPTLGRARIHVEPIYRTGPLPDVGACAWSAKAAIDGMCDAGVLPDDDPAHLLELRFYAPRLDPGSRDRVRITIIEEEAG